MKQLWHDNDCMTIFLPCLAFCAPRSFVSRYKTRTGQDVAPTQIATFANVCTASDRDGLK